LAVANRLEILGNGKESVFDSTTFEVTGAAEDVRQTRRVSTLLRP